MGAGAVVGAVVASSPPQATATKASAISDNTSNRRLFSLNRSISQLLSNKRMIQIANKSAIRCAESSKAPTFLSIRGNRLSGPFQSSFLSSRAKGSFAGDRILPLRQAQDQNDRSYHIDFERALSVRAIAFGPEDTGTGRRGGGGGADRGLPRRQGEGRMGKAGLSFSHIFPLSPIIPIQTLDSKLN